ncbi:heterogeneous nuclear ribonucleoprotein K-like [Octopus bimaculoides]|uniref:heterogeneous nuclear ribonucleoprotein K-like n=1 Tax=Octopus bimaculoides TaxID=37653 RepID=UPI00071D466F|nr:heterogeneous nuclear ribonucleoprotein K-like [Octopus bimaculoides]|eukprot:XP_014773078.1 PREDICTED: heterogeneous nuclear ribonucleoprotein K-like [Octopus bimaculoides]
MENKEGLTKRPLEDVDCSAMKRPRGSKTRIDVRVLLQSKNAGAIIGKGGNNIKRLRNDFKANITVPDCSGPERILTVSTDLETALECLLDIIPSLEEYKQYKNGQDFDCEVRILVHQSQAGCIIGRAGFKVKELREKTGANIKIYSLCCPQSTDRVVAMSGHPPVVTDCIRHIYQLLEAAPPKGVIEPYDPHNFEEFYANDYGGFTFTEGGRGRFPRGVSSMRGNSAAPLMGQQIRGRSMMSGGNGGGGGGGGNGMNRGGGGTSGLPSLLGNANCRNNIGMRGNAVNSLMRNPVGVMNGSMGGGPSSRCSGGMGGRNDNQPNYYGGNQQNFGVQNYSQNRLNSGGMPNQQSMLFGRGHN